MRNGENSPLQAKSVLTAVSKRKDPAHHLHDHVNTKPTDAADYDSLGVRLTWITSARDCQSAFEVCEMLYTKGTTAVVSQLFCSNKDILICLLTSSTCSCLPATLCCRRLWKQTPVPPAKCTFSSPYPKCERIMYCKPSFYIQKHDSWEPLVTFLPESSYAVHQSTSNWREMAPDFTPRDLYEMDKVLLLCVVEAENNEVIIKWTFFTYVSSLLVLIFSTAWE